MVLVLGLLFLGGCFTIHRVYQPPVVEPGQSFFTILDVTTDEEDPNPKQAVACIMVPIDWTVDQASLISPYYGEEDLGESQGWSDSAEVKWPSGDEYKWVGFTGTQMHAAPEDTQGVIVRFDITAGTVEGEYELAYAVTDTGLPFSFTFGGEFFYDSSFANPIEVRKLPHIVLSPTAIDFGSVLVGDNVIDSFAVINTGGLGLIVDSVVTFALPPSVMDVFTSPRLYNTTVPPAGTLYVPITCAPDTADTVGMEGFSGVYSNDPYRPGMAVTFSGIAELGVGVKQSSGIPIKFTSLSQNLPNPFLSSTEISYKVATKTHVSLKIYNSAGELIRILIDNKLEPGNYATIWDGKNDKDEAMPNGIYLYRLNEGDKTITKKLVLVR